MLTVCLSCTSEYAIDPACIEADGRRRRCVPGFKAPEKSRVSHDDPIPMTLSHGSATPMPDLERDFVSVKARATRWPYNARAERRKPVPLRRMGLGHPHRARAAQAHAGPGGFAAPGGSQPTRPMARSSSWRARLRPSPGAAPLHGSAGSRWFRFGSRCFIAARQAP